MSALVGTIQLRKGTTSQWSTANSVLLEGELGHDTTLGTVKMGVAAATAWNSITRYYSFGLIPDDEGAFPVITADGRLESSFLSQNTAASKITVASDTKIVNNAEQAGFQFISSSLDTMLFGNLLVEQYASVLRTEATGGFVIGYGDDADLYAATNFGRVTFGASAVNLSNKAAGFGQANLSVSAQYGALINKVSSGGQGTSITLTDGDIAIESGVSGFIGMRYAADYSANYIARSIPDVDYVNNYVSAVLGGYVPITGGTLYGALLWSSAPVLPSEYVNKAYVDNLIDGIDYKDNVAAATTANITLSGIQTIDTVTGAADLRILVKDQTTQTENGIYLMKSGAWVRTIDADLGIQIEWSVVPVSGGTQAGKVFRCNLTGITLGSTNIVYSEWSSGSYTNGSYLSLSGNIFNVDFSTFSTTQITEGTNLYHTTARARTAISGSGVVAYDNTTGVISMVAATASLDGYLSSTDWNTFNGKAASGGYTASRIIISDGSGNLGVASTGTYPDLTELSYLKGVTSPLQTQLHDLSRPIFEYFSNTSTNTPGDNGVFYSGTINNYAAETGNTYRFISPATNCKFKVYMNIFVRGTLASTELTNVKLQNITASTEEALSSIGHDKRINFKEMPMSTLANTAGDEMILHNTNPAWGTNPTVVHYQWIIKGYAV